MANQTLRRSRRGSTFRAHPVPTQPVGQQTDRLPVERLLLGKGWHAIIAITIESLVRGIAEESGANPLATPHHRAVS